MLRFRTQQSADTVLTEAARESKRAVRVAAVTMTHRTYECELIGDFGVFGEQLTQIYAWHIRLDGMHRPANFTRRFRLHVVGFELAGTTAAPEQNDSGITFSRLEGRLRLQLLEIGQSQTANSQEPSRVFMRFLDQQEPGSVNDWWQSTRLIVSNQVRQRCLEVTIHHHKAAGWK